MKRIALGKILILILLLTGTLMSTFNIRQSQIQTAPDFLISASPATLTILRGSSEKSVITVTSVGGFNRPVRLSVSVAPVLKWTFEAPPTIDGTLAVSSNGTIYYGSYNNKLYAINSDGAPMWIYNVGDCITSSCAVGPDGIIYFVSYYNDELHAINPNGMLKWSYNTTSWTTGWCSSQRPAVGMDGTIYCGYWGTRALYPNGSLKWALDWFESSGWKAFTSFPAISPDGTIYVVVRGCNLSAINPDGTLKWNYYTGGKVTGSYLPCQPAIGPDGTVYFASYDGKLCALHPDGTLKWSYELGITPHSNPVVASNGDIYLGSWEGKLYAFDPNGTLKWSFQPGGWRITSPAIGGDGTLYSGSENGELYALSSDGKLMWSFKAGGSINSPPEVGPDNTVYFGCKDGKLYAIDVLEITNTLNPEQVTPSPDSLANSTLTVSVNATVALGKYTILVIGTSDIVTHNVSITLEIVLYRINIDPLDFSLMPGESITLVATLIDPHGPVIGENIIWHISGDPFLSGTLKIENSTTDSAGQAFATYTAGEVLCETQVAVRAYLLEGDWLKAEGFSLVRVSPNPPLTIPLLIFGVALLLTRALPHKKFRRALTTTLILGFSFILSFPLGGISSNLFSSYLQRFPTWFLAGLIFLVIAATSFSIFEQSSKCGLLYGICGWMGIALGLALPYPVGYMAYTSTEVFVTALSSTIIEGSIFSGILAVSARLGPRIEKARIQYSIKKAEKSYSKGKLLRAAKLYVRALSMCLKTSHEHAKELIERYTRLMKKIIYQAMFRGNEEDKKTLQFAIELHKTLKSNKPLPALQETNQINQLDVLLEKAQNNDLDFIINDALNDKEFSESFLEKISKTEIITAESLAKEFSYSVETTKKLLQESIEKKKIEGFLTLDGNKYVSKRYLSKLLRETLGRILDEKEIK